MKKTIHPDEYRLVVIQDSSDGTTFLTHYSGQTDETIKWEDGKEYPLFKVHISSSSHPFYTGKEKLVDIEGRVDKFKARMEHAARIREGLKSKSRKPSDSKVRTAKRKIGEPTPS